MRKSTAIYIRTAIVSAAWFVPIGCGGSPMGADNGLVTDSVTGACTAPAYAVKVYKGGDQVQNRGVLYQCKDFPFSGWCGLGGAYEPGVGFAWQDAWTSLGPCGSSASGSTSATTGAGGAGTGSTSSTSGSGGAPGGGSGGSGSSSGGTFLQSFSTWYCGNSCGSDDTGSCGTTYCGTSVNPNVVGAALSIKRMNGPSGVWMGGGLCGKHVEIVVQATGKSVTVPVIDACEACNADDHVDLTLAVWEQLGLNTCDGRFNQKWRIVD